MRAPPALEVDGLAVHLRQRGTSLRIVEDVAFSVPPGGAHGLVGESGSGKSITLRALLGLLPPGTAVTAGSVRLDGEDLVAASPARRRELRGPGIAMVFQEPMSALNPVMRVGDQIAEGPRLHLGLSRSAASDRALGLMRDVGIPDPERRARNYPHQFSGGMRQRVMIAIALACRPRVLLCDEPTTALDVTIQDQVLRLLGRLCAESGTSLLFVTHDLPVVAQVCTSLSVMYAGRIVEDGAVADVFGAPHHPYTVGLLRSAPDVDERRDSLVPIPGSPPSIAAMPPGCAFHPRCEHAAVGCSEARIPLEDAGPGRKVACLRWAEVAGREARAAG